MCDEVCYDVPRMKEEIREVEQKEQDKQLKQKKKIGRYER